MFSSKPSITKRVFVKDFCNDIIFEDFFLGSDPPLSPIHLNFTIDWYSRLWPELQGITNRIVITMYITEVIIRRRCSNMLRISNYSSTNYIKTRISARYDL